MPKDEQRRESLSAEREASARLPGAWQAVGVAALAALIFGYWARPAATMPDPGAATDVSQVAPVAQQDMTAALDTVAISPEQAAKFRERDACSPRLAWVTVMRKPGQPPGRIRLQSGGYFSPVFELGDTPVRVALPYPAPYGLGRGTISVFGATADAVVALTPPWLVTAQGSAHARDVTWTPAPDCPASGK